jgi:hypothetical protein
MGLDFGDVPTWLATVGATAAAIFAYRAYRLENQRDLVAADLMRRGQASQVAVWVEYKRHPRTGEPDGADCFLIRNASQLPIYDVLVFSYSYERSDPEQVTPVARYEYAIVPPRPEPKLHIANADGNRFLWVFAMQFKDAAGTTWHRDRHGVLQEGVLHDQDGFTKKFDLNDV